MIVIFIKGMLEEILELINVPDRGYHLRSFVASLSNNHHFLACQENGITYVNAEDVYETGRETGLIIVSTNQEHRTSLMHFEGYMSTFDPKKSRVLLTRQQSVTTGLNFLALYTRRIELLS
mgnify:CR=1 FL=1